MIRAWWIRVVLALGLAASVAGCGSGPDGTAGADGPDTVEFGVGREWAQVFTLEPIDYPDSRAAAREWFPRIAAAFDYPWLDRSEPQTSAVTEGLQGPEGSHIWFTVNNLPTWSYAGREGEDDPKCATCPPVRFTPEQATAWALEIWTELGLDPATELQLDQPYHWEWGSGDTLAIEISARQKFEGVASSLTWAVVFGGPDGEVRSAEGYWGLDAVARGEVPLLTPDEALATRAPTAGTDPATVTRASRVYLDRDQGLWWLVPTYNVDISAEPPLTVHLDAIRYRDLPAVAD